MAGLRGGSVDLWLRRDLGDASLAVKVAEAVRARPIGDSEPRADALLALRAVAVLDPLAPLCWRGFALWPDGLGPALAAADKQDGKATDALVESINAELLTHWTASRGRGDIALASAEARQRRAMLRAGGGARRIAYALNSLLPCDSTLLSGRVVVRLAELVPALEENAGRLDPGTRRIDPHITAFIAARSEQHAIAELAALAVGDGAAMTTRSTLAQLRLFAALPRGVPSPSLACWVLATPDLLLAGLQSAVRRRELATRLATLAEAGELAPILALAADPAGRAVDQRKARAAAAELARIDAELARIEGGTEARATTVRGLGQEAAAGLALGALALSIALTLLG
jgi:eukaryotic-like serine/threonine-protein kinase